MSCALEDTKVLLLDCQATGPHSRGGQLLEIGWGQTCVSDWNAEEPLPAQSFLVDLPAGSEIPERVQRMTGITPDELSASYSRAEVWGRLTAAASAAAGPELACPVVIHFSCFEIPFLEDLHRENSGETFPFRVICTHEIAKRLFRRLPRRGLRALAGYLGHSVPPLRRSRHHVEATAAIWCSVVRRLRREAGVATVEDLQSWLAETEGSVRCGRSYPMDRRLRLGLPDQPGVYRMLRSNGDVLYVGKAASLRRRVNSYFQKRVRCPEHVLEMLTQARGIHVTPAGSPLEAALLESDEIKRLSPPYNRALRRAGREVAFCSRDLQHLSAAPDEQHPLGPLPSPTVFATFAGMARILEHGGEPVEESGEPWLIPGVQPERVPDEDCLRRGFGLLMEKRASLLGRRPGAARLRRLGACLWLERATVRAHDEEEEAAEEESIGKTPRDRSWTPERVAGWLESLIMRGTHWLRRARWLCLLSESSLAWRTSCEGRETRILLVLSEGAVMRRQVLAASGEIPGPAGWRRTLISRQECFDLEQYDRLVVLTSELRRLLASGVEVEIRTGSDSRLGSRALSRVLAWV